MLDGILKSKRKLIDLSKLVSVEDKTNYIKEDSSGFVVRKFLDEDPTYRVELGFPTHQITLFGKEAKEFIDKYL